MFTQCVCVLLEKPASREATEAALGKFEIRKRNDASGSWEFGGPSLVIAYQPDCNGYAIVDTVAHKWPDQMGDPKQETTLFGAWSMGHFGPFAFPGNLQRAAEQSFNWEGGATVPYRHEAFIRVRSSYVLGGGKNSPVMPKDYKPLPELEFVTRLAFALLALPGALCYFNPNGEMLFDRAGLHQHWEHARTHNLVPLDIWSNVRMFSINPEWTLMDTVGNSQLDFHDVEACFHSESYDGNEVAAFLRDVSLYIWNKGDVIKEGNTINGPGKIRWRAGRFEDAISAPPRPVIRFLPIDGRAAPDELAMAASAAHSE
jgi:hypothetical protein